jgi:hypothetical protein
MRASIGLTHMTLESQRLLAANPETAPEILRELGRSDDRAIRQAVAGNPNVPIEVLWELVGEFPHEVIANPLSTLIELENPNWIMDIPGDQLVALLQKPNPPKVFIAAALQYAGYELVGYDSNGCEVDQYDLRSLAVHCIANDPHTAIEYLEEIVIDHGLLYSSIVERLDFGLESFRKITQCDDSQFQRDLVSFFFSNGEDGRLWPQHLNRQEIIDVVIPELIKSMTEETDRVLLLLREELPEKFIAELLENLSNSTLLYLVKSSDTPMTVLKKISETHYADRDWGVCIHKAATKNLQTQLAKQHPNSPK